MQNNSVEKIMKKIILVSIFLFLLCGCGTPPKEDTTDINDKTDVSANITSEGSTDSNTPPLSEEASSPNLPSISEIKITPEDIKNAIEAIDIECIISETTSINEFQVDILEVGSAYTAANTHVRCYKNSSGEIVGIQILCAELTNDRMESNFWKTSNIVFNMAGITDINIKEYVNETTNLNGLILNASRTTVGYHDSLNILLYVDTYDFSDPKYTTAALSVSNSPLEDYPLVTYADIESGDYAGKHICIEAIVDSVIFNEFRNSYSMELWYPTDGTYIHDTAYSVSSDIINGTVKDGDIIRYATIVNSDNSFGTSNCEALQTVSETDIDNIHNTFKSSCPKMDYESIQQTPDNYKDSVCMFSGTVFQIIDENEFSVEYLISTNSGYVYVDWQANRDIRDFRFLEDDSVTIYGKFEMLKTYDTLAGKKTVPYISVILIEN